MKLVDIETVYDLHWKPGLSSVTPEELSYIKEKIVANAPKRFLEIGTGSGLITSFIARFMERRGGGELVSVDQRGTLEEDPGQQIGFLLSEAYRGKKVASTLATNVISAEAPGLEDGFEMAYVDSIHNHPWPTLNLMALYPHLTGPKTVIFHGLRAFCFPDSRRGIGPKYLFDQFPESHRELSENTGESTFALDLKINLSRFEKILGDLLEMPWTLEEPIAPAHLESIRKLISRHYSKELHSRFETCCARFKRSDEATEFGEELLNQLMLLNKRMNRLHQKVDSTRKKVDEIGMECEKAREAGRQGLMGRILGRPEAGESK